MRTLEASEAYRLWAPTYSDETAISLLDDRLVASMTPQLDGLRLLDAGCGTGRRLPDTGAAVAVGLEPCREMVAAGIAAERPLARTQIMRGDVRAMPLPSAAFDVVWCRLVLGHLPKIGNAYAELARVADFGATVIVTDFHPAAVDAGHRRTFRSGGEVIEAQHFVHRPEEHIQAARAAGLGLREIRDAAIGSDVRAFYEEAGRPELYPDHFGLPVVLAFSFRRER